MAELILTIDSREYGGWQSVRLTRSIEQISGSFEIGLTEVWLHEQTSARKIRPGDACTLSVDKEIVLSGWVDDVLPSYDSTAHSTVIKGRDSTGDLVDCSAIYGTGQWSNRSLVQIARDLLEPFSIGVITATGVGDPFEKFALQPGESVFETLERAARHRGVLLVADGLGNLLITRAGIAKIATRISRGENILSASATFSLLDRYKDYIVKGQHSGGDFSSPEQNSQPEAMASDPFLNRYRPLIIMAEDQAHSDALQTRAQWEANVRFGRGSRATITVQGWKHKDGLWQPNSLVQVEDGYLGINREMLISGVTLTLDDKGSRTELALADPAAFELTAIPEPTGDEGVAWM